jgi:hypothetical protein
MQHRLRNLVLALRRQLAHGLKRFFQKLRHNKTISLIPSL